MRFRTEKLLSTVTILSICLVSNASATLSERIDEIINRSSQQKVRWSIKVVEAQTGRNIYCHNAQQPLIPASNMKLITSAGALKYLGPNFEYKTTVGLCGDSLVVIGSGDPLFGDDKTDRKYGRAAGWIFEQIISALKKEGITSIKDIIIDSTIFDDQRVHPNWPRRQLNRWYAAEVCGLNYNGNCVRIAARNLGGKVAVSIEPRTNFVSIINKVEPITTGKSVIGSYRTDQTNQIVVFGKCNTTAGPFDVAIEKPAAFFGYLLAERLIDAGVEAQGKLLEKGLDSDCEMKILAVFRSSLKDCLARCNKDSFQLAAEALFKTIAAIPTGNNGSWDKGRKVLSNYLVGLGIPPEQFFIDDGSGLSRLNRLSANAITTVLIAVYRTKNWQFYKDSLAVGGLDGTIEKYFKEPDYKGRVFGKTGYISGVKSFSGLCSSNSGDYIFSIIANQANGQTRQAINDIVKAIIDDG